MTSDVIVWADVETTGLNPNSAELLEIAVIVTDARLNILDENGYHAIVKHESNVRSLANDYVKSMHDATGLWEKLPDGKALDVIDSELLAYISQFAGHREARLAGNSVRLDANFIATYLPGTSEHLHYRILDVSSVAFEAGVHGVADFPKQLKHEAMSDIVESVNELRYLREKLYKKEV